MEGKAIDNQLVILLHVEKDMPHAGDKVLNVWSTLHRVVLGQRSKYSCDFSAFGLWRELSVIQVYCPTSAVLHVKFGA